MSYKVSLYAFEGPLDLLCHLVKKKEVNIYDIPISEITDEYLEYMSQWKEMDIEVASEFLVMAANLMEIKSKMLLPSPSIEKSDEQEELDPRESLIKRLVEYRFFKNVAENLAIKESEQKKLYTKMFSMDNNLIEAGSDGTNTYFENLNVINLIEAFNRVADRKNKEDNFKDELESIKQSKITVTVKEKKNMLVESLEKSLDREIVFQDLMNENYTSSWELVVSFLALLDLVNEGFVDVLQEGAFAPIWIKLVKGRGYSGSLKP